MQFGSLRFELCLLVLSGEKGKLYGSGFRVSRE